MRTTFSQINTSEWITLLFLPKRCQYTVLPNGTDDGIFCKYREKQAFRIIIMTGEKSVKRKELRQFCLQPRWSQFTLRILFSGHIPFPLFTRVQTLSWKAHTRSIV